MKLSTYGELNFEFAFSLTNESERGAVLVGTSKIENYLEKLLSVIIPENSKAYKSRLFNYPGALSSFSGKIELLYAFRIIDKKLYLSLNALRKVRNKAAHDSESFALISVWEQVKTIFTFELNFPHIIEELSYNNLISFKLSRIKTGFENSQFKDYDYQQTWQERFPDPKIDPVIQEEHRVWQLSYALTFLCLKIEVIADEYESL